ncbi:MAG: phage tail sheath subtilisin-like domain-containing protein [Clostridiales Family XIII bacterium]|jgi:phage tail sheath protein FI|nr:phage tail sheath subtilisin-like domain-containing protein [Clostridiales Family XIII bacterium]
MAEYLSPGVYVEEYDSSPRAIEGVGTSTAGFIGMTVKGPAVGAPSLVTNYADFTRQYGGFLPEHTHGEFRYLPNAVEQFFVNGGTRCYISRVIPEDAKVATASQGILSLRAANEGKWGNKLTISFISTNKRKLQLIASESELVYTAKSVASFREGDVVEFAGEINRIAAISENTITFEKPFATSPVDAALIPKTLVYSVEMDVVIRAGSEVENYADVTLNELSSNYLGKRLIASSLVSATLNPPADSLVNPVSAIFGDGKLKGTISFEGGSDGSIDAVNAGTFIGTDNGPGQRTGLQAFVENNVVSLLLAPGITIPEVIASLAAYCEREKNCFAILDIPQELTKTGEIIEYRNLIDSTYAAFYHPWIQVFDRETKKPGFLPPSGAVAGVFSRTDVSRGVHKAPANEVVSCTGLSISYTVGEQDILNPAGVNLIRALPGQGIRIWGARTASSNAAFKYVNVRRLFIFVEQSIKAATNWVVFEPNNSSLWARVQITIASFLETLFRSGMLAGETAEEAFFVEIGSTTMSRDDILNGRLICNIGIAPSRPAEFVIFRLTQFTAEAGAETE